MTQKNNIPEKAGASLPGLFITVLPVVFLVFHFIFPKSRWLEITANILILFSLSIISSALGQYISAGMPAKEEFSFEIPFLFILIIVISGGVLSLYFGWLSTLIISGIFALFNIIGGILEK